MMHIDRLILRINAVLDGSAEGFEARAIASEYTAIAENVRERLRQCAALIKAGNDNAALQVAEAAPPVLDMASKLAFDRSDKWREYCRTNRLPTPHKLEDHLVELANGLYSKEIGESHPLYRDYRTAVRERDDARALGVLRSIVRVNGADRNAREEYDRLTGKIRRERLAALKEAFSQRRDTEVFAIMAGMESAGLGPCRDEPVWTEAAKHRETWERRKALEEALALVPRIVAARDAGEWEAAIPLLGKARSLEKQYGFAWPEKEGALLAEIEGTAGDYAAEAERVRAGEERIREFLTEADALEFRVAADRRGEEIRADLAATGRWLADAETVAEPARLDDARQRVLRVRASLNATLARRRNKKISIAVASVALAGLIGAGGFHFAARAAAERGFREDLATAESSGNIGPAVAFLEGSGAEGKPFVNSAENATRITVLRARVDDARHAQKQVLDEAAALLRDAGTEASDAELKSRSDTLAAALSTLAPDLRAEAAPACRKAAEAVVAHAERAAGDADAKLAVRMEALDKLLQGFGGPESASAEDARSAATALTAALKQYPAARAETKTKAAATLAAAAEALKSADDTDAARLRLRRADSLVAHLAALTTLSGAKTSGEESKAAKLVLDAADSLRRLPEQLLPPETAALRKAAAGMGTGRRFIPAEPSATETQSAGKLAVSAKFANAWRATRTEYFADGASVITMLYLKDRPATEQFKLTGGVEIRSVAEYFRPDGSSERKTFSMRRFEGRNPVGETIEGATVSKEGQLIAEASRLYDADRAVFTAAPLAMLDRTLASTASPLLKAWVHQEILRIAEDRPEAWGFSFSPEAKRDGERLKEILTAPVDGTAWLTPERYNDIRQKLTAFYAEKRAPYMPAAEARFNFVRTVVGDGPVYAGYVDLKGEAVAGGARSEAGFRLFGLDDSGKPATLGETGADGALKLTRKAAQFSPLLRLPVAPAAAAPAAGILAAPESGDWNDFFLPKP